MTKAECKEALQDFLSDGSEFPEALERIINEWKNSCEQCLTNVARGVESLDKNCLKSF
jgi:hypothetical protein